ncbi:transposase [Natronococcus sp.]|uniref:transposase n=1 Tax=Natronococcus sp. TaxID=35747 RepID=UPI003A4DAE2F
METASDLERTRTTLEHGVRQLLQTIARSASYRGFARHTRLESNRRSRRHLSFWKVGYYVGTTGAMSEKVVERYIEKTEHAPE